MSEAAPAVDTAAPAAPAAPAAAPAPAAPAAAPADLSSLLTDDANPTDAATTDATDAPKGDDGKDDTKGDDKGKGAKEGAPAEYAAFDLPEGVKLDESTMDEFKGVAKELGLSQEQAQKLVGLGAKMQTGNAEAYTKALQETVDKTADSWKAEAKADKEFGGDQFDKNLGVAKTALDTFGTPELKKLLAESRLGNHPEVLRFMFRAGKAISQDGFNPGRAASAAKGAADVLYGSTK